MTSSSVATGTRSYAVLVVEDDPLIRAEAADVARDSGFLVYEARDADRAIALLERHPDILILFTDIVMRGDMDGIALANMVNDRWPPVHILVVSGRYSSSPADLPADCAFLPKPYEAHDVLRTLRRFGDQIAA